MGARRHRPRDRGRYLPGSCSDRFLGSGHPAFRDDPLYDEDVRPLLGLIESTDAGATWRALSLFGDVDFHALRSAHGAICGHDATSGRFMVSRDGLRWDVRGEVLLLGSPNGPQHGAS